MRPWLRSTSLVIISVSTATLLTFPFRYLTVHNLGLFLIAAVMISAWFGGLPAGIASALLSSFAFDWVFDQSPHHLDFDAAALIRALTFCSFALLVASLEKQRSQAVRSLEQTNRTLQNALDEVKTLRGILPICSYCKEIRAADGTWVKVETYIHDHTYAEFSHGMCPRCFRENFPEIYRRRQSP